MAFGDRGRGGGGSGGRGGGSEFDRPYPYEKMAPHEDFPDTTLPEMTCTRPSNEEKAVLHSTVKFEDFWRTSCYHLEEGTPKKKNEGKEVERFSDRKRKTKQEKREALASYLKLTMANFPAEMLQGFMQGQVSNKKLRWDRDSDEQAFEVFQKLEQTHKDGDKKAEKEDDDEDDQEEEEVERDQNSDDDYNQVHTMEFVRPLSLMTMTMTGTKRKNMKTTTKYG